jgi:hypothetical protein
MGRAGTFEDDVQIVNRARRRANPPRLVFSVAAGVREFAGQVEDPKGIYGAAQWVPGSGPVPGWGRRKRRS